MAQKLRPQAETLSGSPQPSFTNYAPKAIIAKRNPATSDTGYDLGQEWVNKVNGNSFQLTQVSAGSANWVNTGVDPSGNVDTLTGDTGGAISPTAGNINIVGGDTVSVAGSGSTLTINASIGGYPISPFIVGPSGQAGYQTIQSAINAAVSAGGVSQTVYVQPGTYTEDLNFTGCIAFSVGITLEGAVALGDEGQCEIIGTHTPPASGTLILRNFKLSDATAIFNSIAAGTAHLVIIDSLLNVTNGYTFNLPNWAGIFELFDINPGTGTDGGINNTGGSNVFIFSAGVGSGTANTMNLSGLTICQGAGFDCPVNFGTGSNVQLDDCIFPNGVTLSGDSTGVFQGCRIGSSALSTAALTMSSSASIALSLCSVGSTNNPAIAGAGAGTLSLGDISFIGSNSSIAGTLTLAWLSTKTGAFTATGNSILNGGTVGIGTDNAANAITVGTGTTARAIHIGDSAAAHVITIGSITGAASITERVGTGNYSLDGAATSTYTFAPSTTSGTINFGGTGANIGTMTIAGGTGAQTVAIANSTGGKTISLATGAGANAVTIGSTNTTSATTIQSGSGGITMTGAISLTGNLTLVAAGNKINHTSVATTTTAGANSIGSVTLVGGTATINTTAVTTNSLIKIWRQTVGATGAAALGELSVGAIVNATSFVINSWQQANATALQASDVSNIGWEIVN